MSNTIQEFEAPDTISAGRTQVRLVNKGTEMHHAFLLRLDGGKRLVLRLHYLEEFMRVCAWCRKLSVGSEWIPLEEFFERKFDIPTSHAMCPTCLVEQRGKLRRAS